MVVYRVGAISSGTNVFVLVARGPCVIAFNIYYPRTDMVVQSIGRSLTQILPKLTGQKMNEFFDIVRPLVEFQFNSILSR